MKYGNRGFRSWGRYSSGQRGQTVNLLTYVFTGSNPVLTTRFKVRISGSSSVGRAVPIQSGQVVGYLGIEISGSSSVGRAVPIQAAGRGFEPRLPLLGLSLVIGGTH